MVEVPEPRTEQNKMQNGDKHSHKHEGNTTLSDELTQELQKLKTCEYISLAKVHHFYIQFGKLL